MSEAKKQIIEQSDVMDTIRQTAMLADVSISVWGGVRSDNKREAELRVQHGAVGNVARVLKNLLAGTDGALKETLSAFAAVRTKHYELTIQWTKEAARREGPRLLPTPMFDRYIGEMSALKRVAVEKLEKFLAEYPDAVAAAKINLGTMFDPNDYPSVEEIRSKFKVDFDFEPLPSAGGFSGLPLNEFMFEMLNKNLVNKQKLQFAEAQAAIWRRISEPIKHLHEVLKDPEKTFKFASVEHVRELTVLIPGWNMLGDELMNEVAHDVEQLLDGVTAENLRTDANLRASIAAGAAEIHDKITDAQSLAAAR